MWGCFPATSASPREARALTVGVPWSPEPQVREHGVVPEARAPSRLASGDGHSTAREEARDAVADSALCSLPLSKRLKTADDPDDTAGHKSFISATMQTGFCDWSARYFAQPVMKVACGGSRAPPARSRRPSGPTSQGAAPGLHGACCASRPPGPPTALPSGGWHYHLEKHCLGLPADSKQVCLSRACHRDVCPLVLIGKVICAVPRPRGLLPTAGLSDEAGWPSERPVRGLGFTCLPALTLRGHDVVCVLLPQRRRPLVQGDRWDRARGRGRIPHARPCAGRAVRLSCRLSWPSHLLPKLLPLPAEGGRTGNCSFFLLASQTTHAGNFHGEDLDLSQAFSRFPGSPSGHWFSL